ncbi:hypothetical protein [Nocardia sp. NPDC057440]|uniref:hypothetical protein n=1 Tax=Nocardia sp. NPDC057440 TaxID=3346134 RepID=UPI003671646F
MTEQPVDAPPPIDVDVQIVDSWQQTYPPEAVGWVISYILTLAAQEEGVVKWGIGFQVPLGTRTNPTESPWYVVDSDGGGGVVVISCTDGEHTVEPGTPLPVGVQLLYLSQADAGDGSLAYLYAIAQP